MARCDGLERQTFLAERIRGKSTDVEAAELEPLPIVLTKMEVQELFASV